MTRPAVTGPPGDTWLTPHRRERERDALAGGGRVDVLVVGGGVTGAGVALDAASRGLRTVLVERGDLACGTSMWSSKLVHGGLRYLAAGDLGLAWQSAVERHLLMTRIAPHLIRPLPFALPDPAGRTERALLHTGIRAGDTLRRAAGTPRGVLPRGGPVGPAELAVLAPALAARSGVVHWDAQLVDDARLVVALARTAAGHGAAILTRTAAVTLDGTEAVLRDEQDGRTWSLRAAAVINATGVWAGAFDPDLRLRPSRGTHLLVRATGLRAAVMAPVAGEHNRFVFLLPRPDEPDRALLGLTDDPLPPGPPPDRVAPGPGDEDYLLAAINPWLRAPLTPADVLGSFAGMRPLLDTAGTADPAGTADLSRRHTVRVGADGVITVTGGKLTTYRAMAEDAVDAAVAAAGLAAGPCATRRLALVGAPTAAEPAPPRGDPLPPARLVARYGSEANAVLAAAGGDPALLAPVPRTPVLGCELAFGAFAEGALDAEDLLARRTRLDLVAADGDAARPLAEDLIAQAPGRAAALSASGRVRG